MKKYILLLVSLPTLCMAEPLPDDPCANLLAVLNRPTVADSVCVAKAEQIIVETGVQYQHNYPGAGHVYNFPQIDFRLGLPDLNEVSMLLPNYITHNGFGATELQFKHQFIPAGDWVYAVEGFLTLPTGSEEEGSDGFGFTANGIINYNIIPAFSVEVVLGFSSETESTAAGGGRYSSFNPFLIFAWQPLDALQFYAEFYAQTKTAPDESVGFNGDAGIQYLITDNIEIDLEYGQRFIGELNNFSNYIGAGAGFRF